MKASQAGGSTQEKEWGKQDKARTAPGGCKVEHSKRRAKKKTRISKYYRTSANELEKQEGGGRQQSFREIFKEYGATPNSHALKGTSMGPTEQRSH